MQTWDPSIPNQQVRCIDDPGRTGVTTGNVWSRSGLTLVEIRFGPSELTRKQYEMLEPVIIGESSLDLARRGNYGSPRDLRRVLTFEKIRGDLTSIFYSMESSNTDFYPHQFKPVLKFVESITGRILIADEVGLGKTIEAMYIWKELRAREQASRLIVICPSMLREKWRRDLETKFGMEPRIVGAGVLVDELERIAPRIASQSFAYIISLEGLRPPADFETSHVDSPRCRFARLLTEFASNDGEDNLFDLAIFDEAHYLRNPATANNRLGRLVRDAARRLVLLTATPIQIGSENLFQLLRILDPDDFPNSLSFDELLRGNRPYTTALRCLWMNPPDFGTARNALGELLDVPGPKDDSLLRIYERLGSPELIEDADRVQYGRLLEGRSFLSRYMTRSRKREVLERRVERSPQVLYVQFTPAQLRVYGAVTEHIRRKSRGLLGISSFAMIARQRQLASCFPAALKSWAEKDILTDFFYENLGLECDPEDLEGSIQGAESLELERILRECDSPDAELEDQKYIQLRDLLRDILGRESDEKVVVFAFFRGTLQYLLRRLVGDGIKAVLIMGGMGAENDSTIEQFRTNPSIRVLLSSEVGSEGIDLQFCHTMVNYDLPWNPMRVEQRIGRLDRLGQSASRISIINFVIKNSIEDRILIRLYERIGLFRESIGEIEEILGEISERLMKDLLDPDLTDAERYRNAMDSALAVNNQHQQMVDLENKAANFLGFSDYLLHEIEDSRSRERWITPDEIRGLVEDFFVQRYPGTRIRSTGEASSDLELRIPDNAIYDFSQFLEYEHLVGRTKVGSRRDSVILRFDPKSRDPLKPDIELVDAVHPLVRWIRHVLSFSADSLHRLSAMRIGSETLDFEDGAYAYSVQFWGFKGLRTRQYLSFRAARIDGGLILDSSRSEQLLSLASREGIPWEVPDNDTNILIMNAIQSCENAMEQAFADKYQDYDAENRSICSQQERSAKKMSERRIEGIEDKIKTFRQTGKVRMVGAFEGQIRAEKQRLDQILRRIRDRGKVNIEQKPVAQGVVFIG